MPRGPWILWLTLVAAAVIGPGVRAGGGPENVLVVVNDEVPESLEIGRHYVIRRDVPRHHLLHVRVSLGGATPGMIQFPDGHDGYARLLEEPVRAWLSTHPNAPITTIVLTRGLPIQAVARGDDRAVVSTTHQLALLALDGDDPLHVVQKDFGSVSANPLYRSDRSIDPRDPVVPGRPLYTVGMLNAFTADDVRAMIDRAVEADRERPGGTVYLARSRDGDPRGSYNGAYDELVQDLENDGQAVEVVEHRADQKLLQDAEDVVFLQFGQAGWDPTFPLDNDYRPGAVVDNLTSYALSRACFEAGQKNGQTPITHFLAAGATAVHGCVAEPTTGAWDPGYLHLRHYLEGYNLIESYFLAHPWLPWRNLVTGDPLVQPFALRPTVELVRFKAEDGRRVLEVLATATRTDAGISGLRLFVNGRLVEAADGADATFELPGFRPGLDRWRVVATDDSRFRTQGSLGSAAPPARTRNVKVSLKSWSRGRAVLRVGGSPTPLFTWVAPGATEPTGTARKSSLTLRYEEPAAAGPVDVWVHNAKDGERAFTVHLGE